MNSREPAGARKKPGRERPGKVPSDWTSNRRTEEMQVGQCTEACPEQVVWPR